MRAFVWVWVVVVAAIGAAAASTQTAAQAARTSLPWTSRLLVDPRSPDVVHAVTNAGLFTSADWGGSWSRPSQRQPTGVLVSAALAPSAPEMVYAGTTTGFWWSADEGRTWMRRRSVGTKWSAHAVVVDPTVSNLVYASTETFVSDSRYVSLYRSRDGARSWVAAARGLGGGVVWALDVAPSGPGAVYAGNANGLWRSRDRGVTWASLWRKRVVYAVALDPAAPSTIYASGSKGVDRSGVYRSDDAGSSWRALGLRLGSGEVATAIVVHPRDSRRVYVATSRPAWGPPPPGRHGVYRSVDRGRTWERILAGQLLGKATTRDPNQITSLVVDPTRPRLMVATWQGIWRSRDGGTTWTQANDGLTSPSR